MKSFFTIVVILLLTGCATPAMYRPAKVQDPGDGAVVMRVLPNMDGPVGTLFKTWATLTLARTSSSPAEHEMTFLLRPTLDATSRTAFYAAGLPPGDYRFEGFSSERCGAVCVQTSASVSPGFSHFQVESGRLTDLGVILLSLAPGGSGETQMVHDMASDHPETAEIVRELVPDLSGLTRDAPLSWKPASVSAEMEKLRAHSIAHNLGFASPQPIDGGGFIYGTAYGFLVSFMPGHSPSAHYVGFRSSIETVLVTSDGDWLVGGELGLLSSSKDRGHTWQNIRGSIPFGFVVNLSQWHNQVIATTLRGKDVYIHAAAPGGAPWRQLAHYQLDVTGQSVQSSLMGDGLVTTLPSSKVAFLDMSTGQSEIRSAPGWINAFSASADGVLRCLCTPAIATNPYESADLGKTWKSSNASRFMRLPTFRDAKHGVAFKAPVLAQAKMVYTEDGGTTWIDGIDAPVGVHPVFYSRDGSVAYLGTAYGAFWASHDDGKTWESLSN
jgi:hypothetical protein